MERTFKIIFYNGNLGTYFLIVSEEEIKAGDWSLDLFTKTPYHHKSPSSSSMQRKIIAHLPLGGAKKLEGVDFLPRLGETKDLEEFIQDGWNSFKLHPLEALKPIEGATKRFVIELLQKKEDEIRRDQALLEAERVMRSLDLLYEKEDSHLSRQIKKSLMFLSSVTMKTPIVPFGFTVEESISPRSMYSGDIIYEPKTIKNSNGETSWVGRYEYFGN